MPVQCAVGSLSVVLAPEDVQLLLQGSEVAGAGAGPRAIIRRLGGSARTCLGYRGARAAVEPAHSAVLDDINWVFAATAVGAGPGPGRVKAPPDWDETQATFTAAPQELR